ncbi:MAG: hypothetical protein KGD67_06590, partial [Candidatus Lokiarchaeota archaeon]|nr:hypothetical protein [Candidatus Lokiarchaeota archaeon]
MIIKGNNLILLPSVIIFPKRINKNKIELLTTSFFKQFNPKMSCSTDSKRKDSRRYVSNQCYTWKKPSQS